MILKCTCSSDFQDAVYGVGMRVHNPRMDGMKIKGYRCTVCPSEKDLGQDKKAEAEEKKSKKK